MDDTSLTPADFNHSDDEILEHDVSDEALEAAAAGPGPAFTALLTDCRTLIAACCG